MWRAFGGLTFFDHESPTKFRKLDQVNNKETQHVPRGGVGSVYLFWVEGLVKLDALRQRKLLAVVDRAVVVGLVWFG
jgi:hypothetical protein